jgi:hypothetical protein
MMGGGTVPTQNHGGTAEFFSTDRTLGGLGRGDFFTVISHVGTPLLESENFSLVSTKSVPTPVVL